MINRSALIVRPLQPLKDWALSLDDSGIAPETEGEQAVYLVPGIQSDQQAARVVKSVFAEVFERELMAWHTDPSAWPQGRTLRMFNKWFQIEIHSVVEDLGSNQIRDDDE